MTWFSNGSSWRKPRSVRDRAGAWSAGGGGDHAARVERFESLALPHAAALYRTAYHLAGNAAEAEDLTQEAYLRAFRAFDGYRGGNPRAWLLTILRHAFLDECRRRGRVITVELDAAETAIWSSNGSGANWAPSAEHEALRRLPTQAVEEAFATLPADWRLVLVLADVEELTYREIAEVAGIPLGTVMSRLHRARKRMQERLMDPSKVAARRGKSA